MIVLRSRRTMIRCTPVCGPGPRLNCVSGLPFGCLIVNETRDRLARADRAGGWKSGERVGARGAGSSGSRSLRRAAAAAAAQHDRQQRPARGARVIRFLSGRGRTDEARRSRRPRARSARGGGRGTARGSPTQRRPPTKTATRTVNESSPCPPSLRPQTRKRSPSVELPAVRDVHDTGRRRRAQRIGAAASGRPDPRRDDHDATFGEQLDVDGERSAAARQRRRPTGRPAETAARCRRSGGSAGRRRSATDARGPAQRSRRLLRHA